MNKKTWLWIVLGAMFPPILVPPLIYFLIYRPIKDGVIGGSHARFYFWASSIMSLSVLATLPIKNFSKAFLSLNDPSKAQVYIISSFILSIISIFMLFYSTRNESDKNLFLPVRRFKPDKLFLFCLLLSFLPLLTIVLKKSINLDQIYHPFGYAIAVVFTHHSYLAVFIGILTVSILTAILEESFFRGILLRDYFSLGKFGKNALLALAAIYFAYCHYPIAFFFPLIFAFYINRIRLAYDNLLPGMILHAIWNACVTIATLAILNVI